MILIILAKFSVAERQEFLALIDRKFSASSARLAFENRSLQVVSSVSCDSCGDRLFKPRKDRWHFEPGSPRTVVASLYLLFRWLRQSVPALVAQLPRPRPLKLRTAAPWPALRPRPRRRLRKKTLFRSLRPVRSLIPILLHRQCLPQRKAAHRKLSAPAATNRAPQVLSPRYRL